MKYFSQVCIAFQKLWVHSLEVEKSIFIWKDVNFVGHLIQLDMCQGRGREKAADINDISDIIDIPDILDIPDVPDIPENTLHA